MPAQDPLGAIKSYLFPMLLSGFTLLVWNDIREIKQDVKMLMAQSNIDKTRIDNLERAVYNKTALSIPNPPNKLPSQIVYQEMVAIKPENDEEPKPKRKLLGYF